MTSFRNLSLRQKCTYCAHLFKAIFRQHHSELMPILKQYIPEDGAVIDIGGHAGQFTKLFSSVARNGHVYTFEPGTYAYSILSLMKKIKGLKNVSLFKLGVSSENTNKTLSVPIKESGSLGYGRSCVSDAAFEKSVQEQINLISLDSFVEEGNFSRLDFIKVDVEGHEMSVLRGAKETLKKHYPALMIEINEGHLGQFGTKVEEVFRYLEGLGYSFARIDEASGSLVRDEKIQDTDYLFYRD